MRSTGGVVLCGGQSSRMGQPKAWLMLGQETMLQRVVRIVSEVVGPVVVVAAPGQDVPELPAAVRLVRDEVEGCGPLGGLAAGLSALRGECEAVYLSACDVPMLKSGFVERIAGGGVGGSGENENTLPKWQSWLTIPHIAGRLHPLAAVYPLDMLPMVLTQIAARDYRMTHLPKLVPTRFLTEADFADVDPQLESLRNVNTWAEYEEIRSEARP